MEPIVAANADGVRAAIQSQLAQGRLKKLRKPPRPRLSRVPERDMRKVLLGVVRKIAGVVARDVIPKIPAIVEAAPDAFVVRSDGSEVGWVPRHDAFRDRLRDVIRGVTVTVGTILDIERELASVGGEVDARSRKTEEDTFKAVVNVQPLIAEPWLQDLLVDFTARNQGFVEKHSREYIQQLEETIASAVRQGKRAEQIEKDLREAFVNIEGAPEGSEIRKLKNKMRLLARDQTATLNADITKARQTQIGVKRFRWRTAKDIRVRGKEVTRGGKTIGGKYPDAEPAHTVLEGKVFDWDKGAPGGLFPGQPINCRCVAEPVLEDLDEGLPSI